MERPLAVSKIHTVKKIYQGISQYFSRPQPVQVLGLFRISIALFILIEVFTLLPDWMLLYGPKGLLPWNITDALNTKNTPSLADAAALFAKVGISDVSTVYIISIVYIISLLALLTGIYSGVAAFFVWLCHLLINTTGQMTAYGVETFVHIGLFYCMVMPVGAAISIDSSRGRFRKLPAYIVTLCIRVIQLHLCIMYFSSGIEKSLGNQWWNGTAVWLALQQDQFHQFDTTWLAYIPVVPKLLGWLTLITEILYPVGMYWKRTKRIWLAGVIGMHLFIMIFLGLYLFGSLMILLNVAVFGYECFPELFTRISGTIRVSFLNIAYKLVPFTKSKST
jgi:hypothetical protein